MCGRYTLATDPWKLAELLELEQAPELRPRYNIAPTQAVAALRLNDRGRRELVRLRWGLVPSWAKDPAMGNKLINARAETVAGKPAFRAAFKRRRCLLPADGFYEWKRLDGGKQPYRIHLADGGPFCFAGLWEHWRGADEQTLETCTIITTAANATVSPLHDRMPVILDPADYGLWLDVDGAGPDDLQALLEPYPAGAMAAYPVSPRVNNPRHDAPDCVAPV